MPGERLAWGILSTGSIAHTFAQGLAASTTGRLVAVGSRERHSAEAFGAEFSVPLAHCHASYEALLADPAVEAVYIATPHPMHAEWGIKAAEAGKHILCEKPLALNYAQAATIVDAARRHDVFLMEAFMYRCHPQTARIAGLVREGAIGEVRLISATYSFDGGDDYEGRILRNDLGGGGILDVGCYPVSLARLIAGAAQGTALAEPLDVTGCARIGVRSRVDEVAIAALRFPGDVLAQLATGVRAKGKNVVHIVGSEGHIDVPNAWAPSRDGGSSCFTLQRYDEARPHEITVEGGPAAEAWLYALEADTVAAYLAERQAPQMTWADSLGNMQALDRWRAAIGLVYDAEREPMN